VERHHRPRVQLRGTDVLNEINPGRGRPPARSVHSEGHAIRTWAYRHVHQISSVFDGGLPKMTHDA